MRSVIVTLSLLLLSCETFHGVWGNSDEFESFKGIECLESVLKTSPQVLSVKRDEYHPSTTKITSNPIAFKLTYSLKASPEPEAELFLYKTPSRKWQIRNSFGRLNVPMEKSKKEAALGVIEKLNDEMKSQCNITASPHLKTTGS